MKRLFICVPFLIIILFAVSGCFHRPPETSAPLLEIHFIDVGYGDAVLVRRGETCCLIDGGYPPMTFRVRRYMESIGIGALSAAVMTHPHPDHIGGLDGVIRSGIPVPRIYSPYPLDAPEVPAGFRDLVRGRGITYTVVTDGDTIPFDDTADFDVIHPETIVQNMNESSLVLFLPAFENGVLFTADIGPAAQERIETLHPDIFPVTLLKAPYHGGYSRESFYRAAGPDLTIISVGINPYGNPWEETLAAAARWSRRVFRLSETGSVTVMETSPGSRDFRVQRH